MESNVGLLLLVGLPGCGKTTLCKKLLSNKDSNFLFIHVNFDDHISLVNQEKFALMRQNKDTVDDDTWKNARLNLLQSIDEMVKALKSKVVNEATKKFINIDKVDNDQLFIVLLDDNFYYKSMRYEYYQLARRQTLGYCQVYIDCSVINAAQNNAKRESQIPESVIQVMAERMETPQAQSSLWERYSITLVANNPNFDIKGLYNLVTNCLKNPVSPLEDREEDIALARLQCSQSLAHQADIVLRSLVGTIIKDAKNTNRVIPSDFSKFTKDVNLCRQKVLTSLQNGTLLLPYYLIGNANTNANEEFRDFLKREIENLL
ncbi:unnamed protein product [Meganyctiphanes norvegica]|uniref:L-seryl-tRNA(Sec) kinase n=1 Tax=Meganyctiphanes norvegica TaxID=48144 RepID=A0AAV2RPX8_MEGNR